MREKARLADKATKEANVALQALKAEELQRERLRDLQIAGKAVSI